MKLLLDEKYAYDNLTMEWLYEIGCIVKNNLLAQGIEEAKAKEIGLCILADLGMLHDGEEEDDGILSPDGKGNTHRYTPRIAFVDPDGNLLSTDQLSYLHEYASGANTSAYEDQP